MAKDAGIRDLFRLIANIRTNGGFAAHVIRAERNKQEPNQGLSDEDTAEQDSSSDDSSEPGVTDGEYENENANDVGETEVVPNEVPQDDDDEGDDDSDVVVEVGEDSNPKKELSMSEKVARPVATPQAKPVCAPVVPFNHDDDVEFVGGDITGTSTSWKASRQQVLMAELHGLRQKLALKRSSSGFRGLND